MTSKKYQELLQCSKRIAEIFYQDVCDQEYPSSIWGQSSQQFALKFKNTLPLLWGSFLANRQWYQREIGAIAPISLSIAFSDPYC